MLPFSTFQSPLRFPVKIFQSILLLLKCLKHFNMGFELRGRYRDIKEQSGTSTSKFEDQRTHDIQIDDRGKNVPPTHGSYAALILHPNWKSRRREILERDQHRCVVC